MAARSVALPFALGRFPVPAGATLSDPDRAAVQTLGRRMLWRDQPPRATFLVQGTAPSGGTGLRCLVQGGGCAYAAPGEAEQVYLLPLATVLTGGEAILATSGTLDTDPSGANTPGLLAACQFLGTDVQLVIGSAGALPVANSWLYLSVTVDTTARRLVYPLPAIICPG
jgi:hypothetical protein